MNYTRFHTVSTRFDFCLLDTTNALDFFGSYCESVAQIDGMPIRWSCIHRQSSAAQGQFFFCLIMRHSNSERCHSSLNQSLCSIEMRSHEVLHGQKLQRNCTRSIFYCTRFRNRHWIDFVRSRLLWAEYMRLLDTPQSLIQLSLSSCMTFLSDSLIMIVSIRSD